MQCPECASDNCREIERVYVHHGTTTVRYECLACGHVFSVESGGREAFFTPPDNEKSHRELLSDMTASRASDLG